MPTALPVNADPRAHPGAHRSGLDHTVGAPSRRARRIAVVGIVAVLAIVGAACGSSKKSTAATNAGSDTTASTAAGGGSGGAYGQKSTTTTASNPGASESASVEVATTSLGSVVVDAKGLTLYIYKNDTGSTSTCVDACAQAWPPALISGTPTAGDGVTGALTTTTRADGTTQLVLGGHPLYRFAGDAKAGDVSGQGIGNVWNAAGPDGQPVG